jgi:UPF0148 protein
MESEPQAHERKLVATGAELLRRGATMLREPCPRCGGIQLKYGERVICLNEDDVDSILSGRSPEKSAERRTTAAAGSKQPSSVSPARKVIEDKLDSVTKQLVSSNDPNEQASLLDLISKYADTLEKLKKAEA